MKKKHLKIQWKSFIFSVIIIYFSQLVVSYIPIQVPERKRVFLICMMLILYFSLTSLRDKNKMAKNAFLMIILFGSVICLIKPIQFGLDEEAHFHTTLRIAEKSIFKYEKFDSPNYKKISERDILRNPNYIGMDSFFKEKRNDKVKTYGKIIGINNFSFLPAAVGWKLGTLFSNKLYIPYYLGRLFNIFAYAILILIALKLSKYFKEYIYVISVFPAVIFICAGYHYDYLYFGLSMISIALLTNFLKENKSVGKREISIFIAISLMFIFPKFPFVLTGVFVCLLPKKCYKNAKDRIFAFSLFLSSMLIALLYYTSSMIISYFSHYRPALSDSVKPSIFFFMEHPLPVVRTFIDSLPATINSFVQPISYALQESRFLISISTIVLLFLILLISVYNNCVFDQKTKVIFGMVLLIITLLVIYAISQDERVFSIGNIFVGGVQGRYYFYMVAILPLFIGDIVKKVLSPKKELTLDGKYESIIQYTMTYLNVITLGVAMYTLVSHVL